MEFPTVGAARGRPKLYHKNAEMSIDFLYKNEIKILFKIPIDKWNEKVGWKPHSITYLLEVFLNEISAVMVEVVGLKL